MSASATYSLYDAIPNPEGTFDTPSTVLGALFMAERGIPQVPLGAKSKVPCLPEWPKKASTDVGQINKWFQEYPETNFGSVGTGDKAGGKVVAEFDAHGIIEKYESDANEKWPNTLAIESRPGHRAFWFIATDESAKLGNVGQGDVGQFSIRAAREQQVSPGSIHVTTGNQFRVVQNVELSPIPSTFVSWVKDNRKKGRSMVTVPGGSAGEVTTTTTTSLAKAVAQGEDMPAGWRNNAIFKYGCKLREAGLELEEMLPALARVNEDQLKPPLEAAEVKTTAELLCGRYPRGEAISDVQLSFEKLKASAPERVADWRSFFKTVGQLDEGDIRMLVADFLPEGVTFIGALPGECKTLFTLSLVKALTTGRTLLGNDQWKVSETIPVIYMIPESSGRAFRKRCEKFGIPNDENKFICRTISEGGTLQLDDPVLQEAVRQLKPVVILDTFIRFNDAEDENSAAQNKQLAEDVTKLRQMGAVAVVALHHATKAIREKGMSLETVLRGTGDIAATADAVYGLLRDDELYEFGAGPNQVEVSCVKARDFNPPIPFQIAASRVTTTPILGGENLAPVVESIIDLTGDFELLTGMSKRQRKSQLSELVEKSPNLTLEELIQKTGISEWHVRNDLKAAGWEKKRGSQKWTKTTK